MSEKIFLNNYLIVADASLRIFGDVEASENHFIIRSIVYMKLKPFQDH